MTDYLIKALLMVKAAQPASGFRPETPQEWRNAQKASEEKRHGNSYESHNKPCN